MKKLKLEDIFEIEMDKKYLMISQKKKFNEDKNKWVNDGEREIEYEFTKDILHIEGFKIEFNNLKEGSVDRKRLEYWSNLELSNWETERFYEKVLEWANESIDIYKECEEKYGLNEGELDDLHMNKCIKKWIEDKEVNLKRFILMVFHYNDYYNYVVDWYDYDEDWIYNKFYGYCVYDSI